jgi:FtsZ-binding cell division protein ZapB
MEKKYDLLDMTIEELEEKLINVGQEVQGKADISMGK